MTTKDDSPHRIQLSRRGGWRLPPNTVTVSRPGRFGNPFPVGKPGPLGRIAPDQEGAVGFFQDMLVDPEIRSASEYPSDDELRSSLKGKNLACWCKLGTKCHADVLLEVANS